VGLAVIVAIAVMTMAVVTMAVVTMEAAMEVAKRGKREYEILLRLIKNICR
jgi:hypothetical protein